jgi:predicted  nucleic acid-binding Zn-ribbon protein
VNHIGDTNKMVSDTPRTDAAIGNSQDRSWMDGTLCRQLERELNAANERTKRLEEAGDALMEIVEGARSERWNVGSVLRFFSQSQKVQMEGGQAVSVEERILFLAESPDCNHPRELRAIAFQVRKLEDRIKQLESENDALRADLLLWEEKEAKP